MAPPPTPDAFTARSRTGRSRVGRDTGRLFDPPERRGSSVRRYRHCRHRLVECRAAHPVRPAHRGTSGATPQDCAGSTTRHGTVRCGSSHPPRQRVSPPRPAQTATTPYGCSPAATSRCSLPPPGPQPRQRPDPLAVAAPNRQRPSRTASRRRAHRRCAEIRGAAPSHPDPLETRQLITLLVAAAADADNIKAVLLGSLGAAPPATERPATAWPSAARTARTARR